MSKSSWCYNAKPSAYYFYMRKKITLNFRICISVPLKFNIDYKRIREWVNNINQPSMKKSTRKWFDGGGRKPVIIEIEENLLAWIYGRRSKMLHISRKMIQTKQKQLARKLMILQ